VTQAELARKYLGKPWVSGARGPHAFDCWGLLWFIYREEFGITLPEYPWIDPRDVAAVTRQINLDLKDWEPLAEPVPGCGVAMSANTRFHHVGIWLSVDEGLILHAAERGAVVAESLNNLRQIGINRFAYYLPRHVSRPLFL
jgi:cell wall-associated NlpC family hydrolase